MTVFSIFDCIQHICTVFSKYAKIIRMVQELERESERTTLKKNQLGCARTSVHRSSRGNGTLLSCPSPCFLPWQSSYSDRRVKPSLLLVSGAIFYTDLSLSLSIE
ncbi:hypothetical protein AMTRI_Chr03g48640 [Amborella trichopoda]